MGNYGLACWDLFAQVVPPASLAQMAFSLGMEAGQGAWDVYWSTALDEMIDELYEAPRGRCAASSGSAGRWI